MVLSFDVAAALEDAVREAAGKSGFDPTSFSPEVRASEPQHGDFQASGVLAYAKKLKRAPRALADELVAKLDLPATSCTVEIAGPGFVNFRLTPLALQDWLQRHDSEDRIRDGIASPLRGQTWVVDYSSPNTAKQMHVGHLRSAVIGESLCRLLAFSGAHVVRDNHVGDWGTQFGKLIWAYKRRLDEAGLAADALAEFERLYKLGNEAAEVDPSVMTEARMELVALQAGAPSNRAIWQHIQEASIHAFREIYDRLGITFDHWLGESFYADKVDEVYRGLTACGLAVESEGALVVFHPEHPRFATQPFIVRKSDGAANYASTDLATIADRAERFGADGTLYVVDKRQSDHFAQLFLTAEKWFERTGRRLPRLEHVEFGTVLGDNGRPLKTRSGENVKLKDLLDEAAQRSLRLVTDKNPALPEAERREIAEVVGIAAVQYADLAQNRSSDYVFSWDKMISLTGNTAPYLLYAVARCRSIFRKAGVAADVRLVGASPLQSPPEIALARKLLGFPAALRQATTSLRPHLLCNYLYELAGRFSSFYDEEPVLVDDPGVRARRLELCARTGQWLELGLRLLGIRTLQRM